jgi:hypothetical protein
VGGAAVVGGATDVYGAATITGTTTMRGTTTMNGVVTAGDGGDTVAINSSDWKINATGDATGLGAVTSDGLATVGSFFTGGNASIAGNVLITGTTTATTLDLSSAGLAWGDVAKTGSFLNDLEAITTTKPITVANLTVTGICTGCGTTIASLDDIANLTASKQITINNNATITGTLAVGAGSSVITTTSGVALLGATASGSGAFAVGSGSVASGESATVSGGGPISGVLGSTGSTASGAGATVGGGATHTASGVAATIGGGYENTASGDYATIPGGMDAVADKFGQSAYAAGDFAVLGDAQTNLFVVRLGAATHISGTWYSLSLNGGAATPSIYLTVPLTTTWTVRAQIVGATQNLAQMWSYEVVCMISNVAGTTSVQGNSVTVIYESDADYNAQCAADDTNDALAIQVQRTDDTDYDIRWVGTIWATQVQYPAPVMGGG